MCVYNGLTFTRLMPGAECRVSGSGCALSLVQVDTGAPHWGVTSLPGGEEWSEE